MHNYYWFGYGAISALLFTARENAELTLSVRVSIYFQEWLGIRRDGPR